MITLAAQTKAFDGLLVTLGSGIFEVIQQAAAQGHQLEQTTAGREVLLVAAEVLGEMIDALAEKRDLIIRTAGVTGVQLVLGRIDGIWCHSRWEAQQLQPLMARHSFPSPGESVPRFPYFPGCATGFSREGARPHLDRKLENQQNAPVQTTPDLPNDLVREIRMKITIEYCGM